jgi:hypothetical protein
MGVFVGLSCATLPYIPAIVSSVDANPSSIAAQQKAIGVEGWSTFRIVRILLCL